MLNNDIVIDKICRNLVNIDNNIKVVVNKLMNTNKIVPE